MTDNKKNSSTINHGLNIIIARKAKKKSQDDIAEVLGKTQSEIVKLEKKETIDKETIEKIAEYLNVSFDFIYYTSLEEILGKYEGKKFIQQGGEGARDNFNQETQIENQANEINIYNPIEEISKLYERLIDEKNQRLEKLEKENEELKKK